MPPTVPATPNQPTSGETCFGQFLQIADTDIMLWECDRKDRARVSTRPERCPFCRRTPGINPARKVFAMRRIYGLYDVAEQDDKQADFYGLIGNNWKALSVAITSEEVKSVLEQLPDHRTPDARVPDDSGRSPRSASSGSIEAERATVPAGPQAKHSPTAPPATVCGLPGLKTADVEQFGLYAVWLTGAKLWTIVRVEALSNLAFYNRPIPQVVRPSKLLCELTDGGSWQFLQPDTCMDERLWYGPLQLRHLDELFSPPVASLVVSPPQPSASVPLDQSGQPAKGPRRIRKYFVCNLPWQGHFEPILVTMDRRSVVKRLSVSGGPDYELWVWVEEPCAIQVPDRANWWFQLSLMTESPIPDGFEYLTSINEGHVPYECHVFIKEPAKIPR